MSAGSGTIAQIAHVVAVMMKNHSYGIRMGMPVSSGADGFRSGRDG